MENLLEAQIATRKEVKKNVVFSAKRRSFTMPEDIYEILQKIATRDSVSMSDVLRKFTKVGLLVDSISHSLSKKLLIRENNVDKEIMLIS